MLRNGEGGFGSVTIVLHWALAVLILGLILTGFVMRRTEIDPVLQFSLYQWHKSFGFTALALAIIRAVWWFAERSPLAPASLSPLERMAARSTHRTLIAFAVIVPLAGWAVASASTLDIPSLYFNVIVIPHLPLAKSETSEDFWSLVHALLAYVMLGLVAMHAAAALYHHFIRHDDVLVRMLRAGSSDTAVFGDRKEPRHLTGRNDP
ncbi:cytochrome b [Sinorhizobium numidicum]|uniref:Cytochrome b n=1 Tax=Sinorhizobium numidicum TaxID=680248 RepID=A0ABY8CXG8_9HYPH|nr:cytochrome b [Sinorhizobium numidicum]WEX78760.1 cytochrome b [Sinorhizobium numidicum]WEX82157.1 cytochrome b [Sinorhizobium numidicum]